MKAYELNWENDQRIFGDGGLIVKVRDNTEGVHLHRLVKSHTHKEFNIMRYANDVDLFEVNDGLIIFRNKVPGQAPGQVMWIGNDGGKAFQVSITNKPLDAWKSAKGNTATRSSAFFSSFVPSHITRAAEVADQTVKRAGSIYYIDTGLSWDKFTRWGAYFFGKKGIDRVAIDATRQLFKTSHKITGPFIRIFFAGHNDATLASGEFTHRGLVTNLETIHVFARADNILND